MSLIVRTIIFLLSAFWGNELPTALISLGLSKSRVLSLRSGVLDVKAYWLQQRGSSSSTRLSACANRFFSSAISSSSSLYDFHPPPA